MFKPSKRRKLLVGYHLLVASKLASYNLHGMKANLKRIEKAPQYNLHLDHKQLRTEQ